MASKAASVWLPKVLFESALITVSILLALALDEWREDNQNQEMIEQAMANFLLEIRQNKARVDDAAPFSRGLGEVLERRYETGDIASVSEFVSVLESYSPAVLQSSAWETAVATGSLAKMEYGLVTALSLTYNLQERYQQLNQSGISDLVRPQNLSTDALDLSIYNAIRYLGEVSQMESELAIVYTEAQAVIRDAWQGMRGATREEADAWVRASLGG